MMIVVNGRPEQSWERIERLESENSRLKAVYQAVKEASPSNLYKPVKAIVFTTQLRDAMLRVEGKEPPDEEED